MKLARNFLKLAVFISLCLSLSGCQTTAAHDFSRLKEGMEKGEVLDVMGSPQRTDRVGDKDRWTYIFYQEVDRQEKEVVFTNGKTSSLGDHKEPTVSAIAQDEINSKENAEVEKVHAARREERKENLQKYENEVKGSNTIRFVPQFEPVR